MPSDPAATPLTSLSPPSSKPLPPPPPPRLQSRQSYVSIPGVRYGQGGPFAIAFWVNMNPGPGACCKGSLALHSL